ncbi:hypothetical protein SDC9_147349 [bioreactor metagenome]|uniref:Uncharacterized protein n=1 Tax=bioreactor metagenome TaxID=1076179 RepID=A0A645EDL6_9ZZZZ
MQHRHHGQLLRRILDARPGLAQITDVIGQLGIAGFLAIGAQNEAAAPATVLGADQLLQTGPQGVALVLGNFLGDADMVVLRQKHQQTPRNADLCRQARTLGTYGVLDDLHHDGLPLEHLLFDGCHRLVLAREHRGFAVFLTLPDIGHMQKGRTLQADIDEGGLHAGQHARDLAQIDVADEPPLQRALHVQLLHGTILDNRHPRFLRRPVDQNILLH